jgi:hypothetical protein
MTMMKNKFAQLGNILSAKPAGNFLSEKTKTTPLNYQAAPPIPKAPTMPMPAPVSTPSPGPVPQMPSPPMTNVNAVPNVNHIPANLSRITKVQKLDRFPRLYHVVKS